PCRRRSRSRLALGSVDAPRRALPRAARRLRRAARRAGHALRGRRGRVLTPCRRHSIVMTAARDLELYLVRHAPAAERGPGWPEDEARPLTSDGAAKFRKA